MSNALAIAGVTAVLRDLLDSGLIDHAVTDAMGSGVAVSAAAPDTIALEGTDVQPRLNLFLHQATPNAAWRNMGLPSRAADGARISNPPLALDLHYLVTAYGAGDLQAEVLLGYAMQLLHETPVLTRDAIRTALNPPSAPVDGGLLPSVYQALRATELAEQYEQIRITPAPMNTEEMSKLWSALQAHYRPTASYQVSVVLIESRRPARAPLPVLTRGPRVQDPVTLTEYERGVAVQPDLLAPFPQIERLQYPGARTAAHLGDTVILHGHRFDGSDHRLLLSLPRLGVEREVFPFAAVSASTLEVVVPALSADFPAGTYLAAVRLQRPGEPVTRVSNEVPLVIAPQITTPLPAAFARDADGNALITLDCTPEVRPGQRAALLLGSREVTADAHPAPTSTLSFTVSDAPAGDHRVRLRVDGIDSEIVDRSVTPPTFLDHRVTIT